MHTSTILIAIALLLLSLLHWYRLPTFAVARWMRQPERGFLHRAVEMLLAMLMLGLYGVKMIVTAFPLLLWYIIQLGALGAIIGEINIRSNWLFILCLMIPYIWYRIIRQILKQSPYKKFDDEVKIPLQPWPGRPTITRDVAIPTDYEQPLLCDVYQPVEKALKGDTAIIHLHATAWQGMDKGQLTKTLFHRLVDQGHTIIDVAYTLAPTADMAQMVAEVKHAIAWVKEHADDFQINPEKIILMGESGGGHLALLSAYTPNDPDFQPASITTDTSVYGVVAIHAPTDLAIAFEEFGQMEPRQPETSDEITDDMQPREFNKTFLDRLITNWRLLPEYRYQNMPGGPLLMVNLMGGTLQENPEAYARYSPLTHVSPDCPPTLYLTGAQDFYYLAPYGKMLHEKLVEAGVPSVYHSFKLADHGFLLFFPRISPVAKTGMYTVAQWLNELEHPQTIPAKG